MGEAIVIAGKGGSGKTVSTAYLGAALALRGKQTVLVDASLGLRCLDLVLGRGDDVMNHLYDVITGRCERAEAILEDSHYSGLFLLPAPQTRVPSEITEEQMKLLVWSLKERFDYVLIDSPAGIEQGFVQAAGAADRAVVCTSTDKFSVRAADRILGLLERQGIRKNQILFQNLPVSQIQQGTLMNIEDAAELLGFPVIGTIPHDPALLSAADAGSPFMLGDGRTVRLFRHAAGRLLGEQIPMDRLAEPGKGLLQRLFRR